MYGEPDIKEEWRPFQQPVSRRLNRKMAGIPAPGIPGHHPLFPKQSEGTSFSKRHPPHQSPPPPSSPPSSGMLPDRLAAINWSQPSIFMFLCTNNPYSCTGLELFSGGGWVGGCSGGCIGGSSRKRRPPDSNNRHRIGFTLYWWRPVKGKRSRHRRPVQTRSPPESAPECLRDWISAGFFQPVDSKHQHRVQPTRIARIAN